jgi:hypothetical protein
VDRVQADPPPQSAPALAHATYERACDDAVATERRARITLAALVAATAGARPCAVIFDNQIITLADDFDGMAVVPTDRIIGLQDRGRMVPPRVC